eukprot:772869-Ditylum_brightwellii.AAC.1
MEARPTDELLAEAETKVTSAKITYSYSVKVDFPGPENSDAFNLHKHFAKLMQEMIRVDRGVIVGATTKGKYWTNPRELPMGNNFTKIFNVNQEM